MERQPVIVRDLPDHFGMSMRSRAQIHAIAGDHDGIRQRRLNQTERKKKERFFHGSKPIIKRTQDANRTLNEKRFLIDSPEHICPQHP